MDYVLTPWGTYNANQFIDLIDETMKEDWREGDKMYLWYNENRDIFWTTSCSREEYYR